MKITISEVIHVAQLARLKLETDELGRFQKDLDAILGYMDMLAEIDMAEVVETDSPAAAENVLRNDVVQQSQERADVLSNAPLCKDGRIVVPKVIE